MVKKWIAGTILALTLALLVTTATAAAPPDAYHLIHIVRYGETLSGIAVRYGVNMWALARANGIANPSRIYAGQRLVIPSGWHAPAYGGVHIVRYGETLSGIAAHYGLNMWALAHANGIANPHRIYAGQRLIIPWGYHGAPYGGVHIVRHGETLSGIAYRYGVTVWAIAHANGIANPHLIYVGQRLAIPGW